MTEENPSTEPDATSVDPVPTESPTAPPVADAPVAKADLSQRARPSELKFGYYWGLGRRKSAVARVRVREGDGKFLINSRPHDQYFATQRDRDDIIAPLKATDLAKHLDVFVNVKGGGTTGQAGAVLLGLARAIRSYDAELEPALRSGRYLTRDSRKVERKKYGQRGARRRFQFSKR